MTRWDVLVIGAGHNGLVAATKIAKAGRKVLVLEARAAIGGLCSELEFHPGYQSPGILHDTSTFSEQVEAELSLARHDLSRLPACPPVLAASAGVLLPDDPAQAASVLSPGDAEGYARYRGFLDRIRPLVQGALHRPPPPLAPATIGDYWNFALRGLELRRLGKVDMTEIMRVTPMCSADWLNEHFEDPAIVELLAAPSVLGTFMGPWSAGTAATLLLWESLRSRPIAGGAAALVRALAAAAASRGVEVRTDSSVTRIRVSDGSVVGVTLASGEELEAPWSRPPAIPGPRS